MLSRLIKSHCRGFSLCYTTWWHRNPTENVWMSLRVKMIIFHSDPGPFYKGKNKAQKMLYSTKIYILFSFPKGKQNVNIIHFFLVFFSFFSQKNIV